MKQISKIFAMLVLMLGITFSVTAQQRSGAPQQKKQMKCENREMLPDLTDAQKDQMKTIRLKSMKATQTLKNQLMEKRAHLNTLSSADKADMKAINKQIDEIATLQASMQKVRANSKQEMRSILTDDQRILFDAKRGGFSHHKRGHGTKGCEGNGSHQNMRSGGQGQQ